MGIILIGVLVGIAIGIILICIYFCTNATSPRSFERKTEPKPNRDIEIGFLNKDPEQGMYKNRVKSDRNFFEIPALLSWEQGNSEWENSK